VGSTSVPPIVLWLLAPCLERLADGSAAVDNFEDLRFDRAISKIRQAHFHTAEASKLEQYL